MILVASAAGYSRIDPRVTMDLRRRLLPDQQFINPLFAPAEADIIDLALIKSPEAPFPRLLRKAVRPTVCLVGDDPGDLDGFGGPDAWRATNQLAKWCRAAFVHGSGGAAAHYAFVTRNALHHRRMALVETTSLHARNWAQALHCPNTLTMLPRDGVHPIRELAP